MRNIPSFLSTKKTPTHDRDARRQVHGARGRHRHDRMITRHPWGAVGHGEIPRDRVVQRLQVAFVRAPGQQGLTAGGLEGEDLAERHGHLEEEFPWRGRVRGKRSQRNASLTFEPR